MTQDEIRKIAKEIGMLQIHGAYDVWVPDYVEEFAKLVAEHEREACAKVVDDIEARCIAKDVDDPPLEHIAAAIRSRGTT